MQPSARSSLPLTARRVIGALALLVWWLSLGWLVAEFFPRRLLVWMGPETYAWFVDNGERLFVKFLLMTSAIFTWLLAGGWVVASYGRYLPQFRPDFVLVVVGVVAAAYIALVDYFFGGRDRYDVFANSILLRVLNMRKNLFILAVDTCLLLSPLPQAFLFFPSILLALMAFSGIYKIMMVAYYPERHFDAIRHAIMIRTQAVLKRVDKLAEERRQLLGGTGTVKGPGIERATLTATRSGYIGNREMAACSLLLRRRYHDKAAIVFKSIGVLEFVHQGDTLGVLTTVGMPAADSSQLCADLSERLLAIRDMPHELAWLYDVALMLRRQMQEAQKNQDVKAARYTQLLVENLLELTFESTESALQSWRADLAATCRASSSI